MNWTNDFSELAGERLTKVDLLNGNELLIFTLASGAVYQMFHRQDCCESVYLEDVTGSWDDIIGEEIVEAYETAGESGTTEYGNEYKWTFYTLTTFKGCVTLRWYGSSNGYYSTAVTFEKVN